MKEEQRHILAFESYFKKKQVGATTKASVEEVAKEQDFNVTTIWKWKKIFHWDEREAVRQAKINKRVEERTNKAAEDDIVNYLSLINNALSKYGKDIQEGKRVPLEIKNANDLTKLINCGANLHGYGDNKQDINVNIVEDKQERLERLRRIEKNGSNLLIATPTKFDDTNKTDSGE